MSEQFREPTKMVLLPCPFCGGESSVSTDPDGIKDTEGRFWAFTVVCGRCAASSGLCYSTEMAIKSWNTRRPMERIVEQLEELRMRKFLTIANTGDKSLDAAWEEAHSCIDKAIEIIQKGGAE